MQRPSNTPKIIKIGQPCLWTCLHGFLVDTLLNEQTFKCYKIKLVSVNHKKSLHYYCNPLMMHSPFRYRTCFNWHVFKNLWRKTQYVENLKKCERCKAVYPAAVSKTHQRCYKNLMNFQIKVYCEYLTAQFLFENYTFICEEPLNNKSPDRFHIIYQIVDIVASQNET